MLAGNDRLGFFHSFVEHTTLRRSPPLLLLSLLGLPALAIMTVLVFPFIRQAYFTVE